MIHLARRSLVQYALAAVACACADPRALSSVSSSGIYVCPPCGCAMDGVEFSAAGICPACGMQLVAKDQVATPFEPNQLVTGASAFLARGGRGREDKRIGVHYYKPRAFTRNSRILLLIPGAGRNGDVYRDAWIEAAERANVLVAALSYPEGDYDNAGYLMGGVVSDLVIRNAPGASDGALPAIIRVRDEDISFTINPRRDEWLFHDFDRIFALIVAATGSTQSGYDMFGHSAGAQILHRFILFHPDSHARQIMAANAGFYTLPDLDLPQPVGVRDTGVTADSLVQSFSRNLTLLLGQNDDGDEAGGFQIHTPMIDRQGLGRASRGRCFFRASQERARAMGVPFNWRLQMVPNVGHDFRAMSQAAARVLYG